MPTSAAALDLLTAALIGLAVGLEREWTGHTTGPDARFAGLRTFALLGAIGGFAGWFGVNGQIVIAACLFTAAILFPIAAYSATLRRPGTTADGTTEVAAILVITLGAVSGLGERAIASAAGVIAVVLLAEKTALKRVVGRIDVAELRATLQFAVMALVVLPILPNGAYGPYQTFAPRQLWSVVLLFSGLNFAGYIARRIIGESRGLGLTGLLGGVVSSTAVTLTFSRRSRLDPALAAPLALGVAGACTVLIPRVAIIASLLQPAITAELLPLLLPIALTGLGVLLLLAWQQGLFATRRTTTASPAETPADRPVEAPAVETNRNPLALGTAIQMAIALQAVLLLIAWIHDTLGDVGVLTSAGLLGLTDMDALTLSMSRLADDARQVHVAARAIVIGILANTALKLLLITTLGAPRFRLRAAVALVAMGAAGGCALWWHW